MINKAIILGRVGRDPEIRHSNKGHAIGSFSVATSETWKDKQGERQEKTEWHRVVVFGKLAEAVVQPYVKKGGLLYIEGKLQTRKWDKDGVDHYTTEIAVDGFGGVLKLLGGKDQQGGGSGQHRPAQAPQQSAFADAGGDDDIPF